jgi:hypothetical protein
MLIKMDLPIKFMHFIMLVLLVLQLAKLVHGENLSFLLLAAEAAEAATLAVAVAEAVLLLEHFLQAFKRIQL